MGGLILCEGTPVFSWAGTDLDRGADSARRWSGCGTSFAAGRFFFIEFIAVIPISLTDVDDELIPLFG